MRLKSLEIVGFKSFADPFRIDFRQGISSIVGPNGCGKSNVADAVRWVLGTQSPKQLRADRMESVIFSGSLKRKQLGMAEVTLTFDNSDRSLDLDYDEVSVSRRLFRSGDSEYSINGARCRLMDITDLVVDRGLGATGYWILETRMVETILSSRPEDRRFLFDEAAGIVKYKIQRHRAELKLDSAAADLERLADIIAEVEGTCRGLKKQVSAYRKHEKITGNMKSLREARSLIESRRITKALAECTGELDQAGALVGQLTAVLSSRTTALEGLRTEFGLVQGKLDEAHRSCSELDSSIAAGDRESAVTSEKIEGAERRISENRARSARELERIEVYRRDITSLEEEKDAIAPEVKELEILGKRLAAQVEEQRGRVDLEGGRLDSLRKQRSDLESLIERAREENLIRIREHEAALQRITLLEERTGEMLQKRSSLEEDQVTLEKESARVRRAAEGSRKAGEVLLSRADDLEEKRKQMASLFESQSEAVAVAGEKVRRAEELIRGMTSGNSLSELVEPAPGMGIAVGSFLTGFDRALTVDSLPEDQPSDGSLFALETGQFPEQLPEGAVPLSSCISTCSDPILAGILGRGILAGDRDQALKWIRSGVGYVIVTPEGDIFRPEGFVRTGIEPESAGLLELRDILARCSSDLEEKRAELENTRTDLALAREELKAVSTEIQENSRREAGLEKELEGVQERYAMRSAELEKTAAEISQLSGMVKELQDKIEDRTDHDRERMDELKEKKSEFASAEDELASRVSVLENELSAMVRESDRNGFSLLEKKNRYDEINRREQMLQRETDRMDELVEELERSSDEAAAGINSMKERIQELKGRRTELAERRTEAEKVRTALAARRNELMEKSSGTEREVQEIREKLSRSKSTMIEKEAAASSLRSRLETIQGEIGAEENPWLHLDPDELESRLEAEQTALERLGPVNMLAVGEFEENSRRLAYLKEQRKDLEDARESLSRAIGEINREAAQRFRETFDQVREHFNSMFVKLFGGGEGDISSIEGDDPLEGGIEIMARPPGKKLKNVIALSAGEKALTAVALLFSLYLVKPSPFCVLDELDGPFDDANTDKFIAILREFSSDTQFIVITHNKRTMEGSDILYGITMAEQGVSSITSVSLEEIADK